MIIDTKNLVSISEANQNFSKVANKVDKLGSVVILKNNIPKYIVLNYAEHINFDLTEEEKIEITAKRILKKHKKAFKELA